MNDNPYKGNVERNMPQIIEKSEKNRNYILLCFRAIGIFFIFQCSPANAACSTEYFNLAAVLGEYTGGNPIADQLRRARLAQAQSALGACRNEERREKAERIRIAEEERLRTERLRIEQENAAIERARVDQLATERGAATQEAEAARFADQDLRARVSQAVLEGRCEDAKTIALIASRLDMAEQALRICKPQATKPPLVGATSKKQVGQVVPQPKVVARVSQTKPSSPYPAPSRLTQPTVVAPPSKPTPDQEAFKLAMTAAAQGYNNAQFNVAKMYAEGRGVTQNDAAAVSWYRAAAEQGNFKAQSALGLMYETGRGVTQSYAAAVIWYRKAADQGFPNAQTSLGVMYANGLGVAQDDAAAVSWYRKAADQGFANAQYNLGVMYAIGRGVTQSDAAAIIWYKKAADQGFPNAQTSLGVMYANGLGVAQDDAAAVSKSLTGEHTASGAAATASGTATTAGGTSTDKGIGYVNATPQGPYNVFVNDDYPTASRRAGEEGVTRVSFVVGVDGQVSQCEVVQTSGFQRLDDATCSIVTRRFRYNPATLNGQPVPERRYQPMRWRLLTPVVAVTGPFSCKATPAQIRTLAAAKGGEDAAKAIQLVATGEKLCAEDAKLEAGKKFARAAELLGTDLAALSTTSKKQN